jgi:hypothetical protein
VQISYSKEKIMGQRVLDTEDPTMQTTVSLNGSFKSTPLQHCTVKSKSNYSYVYKYVPPPGGLSAEDTAAMKKHKTI